MNKLDDKFYEINTFCEQNADPGIVKKYARYFTEGYDAYGIPPKIFEDQKTKWLEFWKDELSIDDFLHLGDLLVSTGKYELVGFAVHFIAAQKEKLTGGHLPKIGSWLENGIANWAGTDLLCSLVLSHFVADKIVEVEAFADWLNSPSCWKRRAVPVTMINALKTGTKLERLLAIINPLMMDPEKFVQKGLGWFLREAWKKFPAATEVFLLKWKDSCGRIIIQYATEKMEKDKKIKFKRAKK